MLTPKIDVVYKFSFVTPFQIYDGFYKVLSILSLDELIKNNLTLLDLYTGAGLTEADLEAAIPIYRTDRILKLMNVADETNIIYIPMSLGKLEPDPNVKSYPTLALAVNLGIFDNVDKVVATKNAITSYIAKGLGISEEVLVFSIKDTWMTLDEYNIYEAERINRRTGLVNLYSEVARLRKELDSANVKIKYYEDKFIELGNDGLGVSE